MQKIKPLSPKDRQRYEEILRAAARRELNSKEVIAKLSREFGRPFPPRTVRDQLDKIRKGVPLNLFVGKADNPTAPAVSPGTIQTTGTGSDSQVLESLGEQIKTVDQALAKGGVDRKIWDVERFVINSWEVGAKGPDGIVRVTPLWQVKVWLKAKRGWDPTEFRQLLVSDLKKLAPSYRATKPAKTEGPLLAELSIFDAHFGKLAWAPETGQDYDLKICRNRYMAAGRDLLARAAKEDLGRILYVVGNDFYHTDQGRIGATTAGTYQDCDGRWQKAFRLGKDCAITLAEEAAQIAPVDIMIVPGNHDSEKVFCLGEVLDARFSKSKTVKVHNTPDVHSYYRWGNVLLGFVHGDNHNSEKKRDQLPATMATDRPKDWAETVWREIHLGHTHSEFEELWKWRSVKHVRDVAVRVLPSLSSTDAWHRRSGYRSVLAAECHLYHRDRGRYQYLVHCAEG